MLSEKEKKLVQDPYFQVLRLIEDYDEDYVELKSKCTMHCWAIRRKGDITGYNSSLGNKSFKEKKERKDSNGNPIGYLNGLNLNADPVNTDNWTVDQIKARTNKLVSEILALFTL